MSKELGTVGISMDDIRGLVIDAVKAAREPDPETKAKAEAEKERRRIVVAENVETARIEMEQQKRRQDNCAHMKENGKPSTGGQLHSDGMVHEFCLRCQKVIRVYKPSQEMIMSA